MVFPPARVTTGWCRTRGPRGHRPPGRDPNPGAERALGSGRWTCARCPGVRLAGVPPSPPAPQANIRGCLGVELLQIKFV